MDLDQLTLGGLTSLAQNSFNFLGCNYIERN